MKSIAIDLRVLDNQQSTGIGHYAFNVTNELLKYDSERYLLIGNFPKETFACGVIQRWDFPHSDLLLANKLMSLMGYCEDIDLLFSPFYPIPERRVFTGVITVHDVIPLRFPVMFASTAVYEFYDRYIRQCIRSVRRLVMLRYTQDRFLREDDLASVPEYSP